MGQRAGLPQRTEARRLIEDTITICNKLGLHARAAAKFVETSKRFGCAIEVRNEFATADGKSIMKVMLLQATLGSDITIKADGTDESDALSALLDLVSNRFGEDE